MRRVLPFASPSRSADRDLYEALTMRSIQTRMGARVLRRFLQQPHISNLEKRRVRILMAEDNLSNQHVARAILKKLGYNLI